MDNTSMNLDGIAPGIDWLGGALTVGNGTARAVLPFDRERAGRAELVEAVADVLAVRLCIDYDELDGPDSTPRLVAEAMADRIADLWEAGRYDSAADLLALMCDTWAVRMGGRWNYIAGRGEDL